MTRAALGLALLVMISSPGAAAPSSAIVIDPDTPSFGQTVGFSWTAGGEYVNLSIWCFADATTVPAQPAGTQLLVAGATLADDGVYTQPTDIAMGPTSNWTAGGASCTAQVGVLTYSGSSGNYQQKFTTRQFTVVP
jgi:hypothetical protein